MLDDLQWAAKPTLLLLRHVVRAGGGRVLILGTYRDTELAHDHPLVEVLADLRRQGGVERLSLSGLDDAGVAAFVEQAAGRTLDETASPWPGPSTRRRRATRSSSGRCSATWPRPAPSNSGRAAGRPGCPSTSSAFPKASGRWSAGASPACRTTPTRSCGSPPSSGPSSNSASCRRPGDLERGDAPRRPGGGGRGPARDRGLGHPLPLRPRPRPRHAVRVAHRRPPGHAPPQGAEAIETIHEARARRPRARPRPPLGEGQRPGRRYRPGPSTTPGGPGTGPSPSWPMTRRPTTTPPASSCSTPAAPTPDDPRRLELLIGRGEAQRRAGDPGYRETLLDAARLAARARRRPRPRPSHAGQHAGAHLDGVLRSTPTGSRCSKRPSPPWARRPPAAGPSPRHAGPGVGLGA